MDETAKDSGKPARNASGQPTGAAARALAEAEARRAATARNLIAEGDPTIEAVASDAPLPGLAVPVFDLDDIPGIASFILRRVGLG